MLAKGRNNAIDAVKGVCILCITLLHFENGFFSPRFNWWIGLFMVPGFYFISGYLFAQKNTLPLPVEFAKKRLIQLGWPYFCFVLLALFFELLCVLCGYLPIKVLFRDGYKALVLHGIGPLWFLPVLFFGELLFVIIASCRYTKVVGCLAGIFSLLIYHFYFSHWLPNYRNASTAYQMLDAAIAPYAYSCWAWLVITSGYLFGRHAPYQQLTVMFRITLGIAAIAISWAMMFWIVAVPFFSTLLSNVLPPIGLLLIFSTMNSNIVLRTMAFWGRNSLLLMCLHYTIFEEAFKIFDSRILGRDDFTGWPPLVYLIITLAVIYAMVPLFSNKLRFMRQPR